MAQPLRIVLVLVAPMVLVSSLPWTSSGVARAAPAGEKGDPYDAAHDAEARLDYRAVLTNATAALAQANTHDRLVELYRLLGTANAVLGKSDDAVDAFTRLLAIDPDHRLPRGLSPKITRPFKEAGGYWIDRPGGLGVTPDVAREIAPAKPLTVSVKLDDPLQMAAKVRLSYRREGDPDYMTMEQPVAAPISLAVPGSGISFTIPADQIQARHADYNLELFFTVLGPTGSELRAAGDPAHPITSIVRAVREEPVVSNNRPDLVAVQETPKTHKKSVLTKWWFWTAVGGVVVVGAALGGGLGYYYSRDTAHVDVSLTGRVQP